MPCAETRSTQPMILQRQDTATSGLSLASEALTNRDLEGDPSMRLRLWDRSASLPAGYDLSKVQNTVLARSCSSSSDSALEGQGSGQLVQCLLRELLASTTDRQRLADQVSSLQKENQQLACLVMELSDTLKQQQQQTKLLLQLQRQQVLQGRVSRQGPSLPQATLAQQQAQHPRQAAPQQHSTMPTAAGPMPVEYSEAEEPEMVVSATLPSPEMLQAAQQQRSQHKQQQARVAEWLQHRGWQEWQERLPLEPVSSSSSSSLILALEESMLRP